MEEDNFLAFDSPKESSSYIKVIGVGGGGGNAVNHMYAQGIKGVDFIVCNTDEKALNDSPVSNKIALSRLGAGNNPQVAKAAAEKNADLIRDILSHNTQMLFITAGMGGGTGTGASPVIAQIAKQIDLDDDVTGKILVVAIVTMPFSFEGRRKKEQAEAGIAELRKHVDSILVINNDKLRAFGDKGITGAFALANDVLLTAAKGIAEIITSNALVNIDFRDVNTVMHESGTALMGTGEGRGENRAMEAIKEATTSVLLNDNDISGAKDALLYISYGKEKEVTMDELTSITDYVEELIDNTDCTIIWGYGADDTLTDEIKITLIATGFEKKSTELPPSSTPATKRPFVLEAPEAAAKVVPAPVEETPADATEPYIVSRPTETPAPVAEAPIAQAETPQPVAATQAAPETVAEPAPEPVPTFQPQGSYTEVEAEGHTKRVFKLDAAPAIEAEAAVEDPQACYTPSEDKDYTDIRLITPQPAPAPEPVAVAAPKVEAANPFNVLDQMAPASPSVQTAPAPVQTQAYAPVQEPQRTVIEEPVQMRQGQVDENTTLSRAERIKRIHELLTQNPNGPQMVEDMAPETALRFSNNATSHLHEAQKSTIAPDGSILSANSYLYDNPD